jgi:hypothetical protein
LPHLNPLDEQQLTQWRARLLTALVELREGRVLFLDGIRRIIAIANEPRERDKDFDLVAAIDSETDHLPSVHVRPSCSKEWLAKCDQEASEVEAFYREAVSKQLERLLIRFAPSEEHSRGRK